MPACDERDPDVMLRLDCLQLAFAAGRLGPAEYEERKAWALTLIDPPHMGTEEALRTLNEALRRALITPDNYHVKVGQVISRL
ncbi:MAG: hypothetical protein L6R19_25535 [Alphaproteobacteria bacterium]|nr:hypothetical protein [Alphaproteobacteria bacterium]